MSNSEHYVVQRVYNNNVVLALHGAETGAEVVLLGKGIGFQKRPGDAVDNALIGQRFVADSRYKPQQVADLLSDADPAHIALAIEITRLGETELGLPPRQSLLLPVLDHLEFAVRRAREGMTIDFPLRWEVQQLYPRETLLGRRVVALVAERLGVALQSDEWVAFALHYVNQQWAQGDIAKTVTMTETIGRVFALLGERWGQPVDENAPSASRFVTHLRYLFARVATASEFHGAKFDVLATVRAAYPEAADAAVASAELIGEAVGRVLGPDEVSYIALHTGRLYAEQVG